jgi:hypothetical protein
MSVFLSCNLFDEKIVFWILIVLYNFYCFSLLDLDVSLFSLAADFHSVPWSA